MPEPTNPRKKALMPAGPLRKNLRAAGHHLSPIVQVGKEGVTDAVLRQLDQALFDHELVKVKVGTETPEDRFEAAERLGAGSEAQVAQILGRTMLLYRRHPDAPKFEPRPKPKLEPKTKVVRKPGRGERKPERGERKPGRMDRKPDRGERKPGRMDRKPERGERKPGRVDRKPERGERKTERADRKPARGAKEPRGRAARGGPANSARPRAPRAPARRRRG